jgi:hypothetical protein
MKMKRLLFFAIPLLLIMMLLPAGVAHAAPNFDQIIREGDTVNKDVVTFGDTLIIQSGAQVNGDVAAFGSSVTLDGTVEGDVAVFGGSTTMKGTVKGDLVLVGSSLSAGPGAKVEGDCVLVGQNVHGESVKGLNCSSFGDFSAITIPAIAELPILPTLPNLPTPAEMSFGFFGRVGDIAGRSLLFGLLALALAAIAPKQLNQVTDTMKRRPAASGAVGFLTAIAAVSLLVIVAILTAVLLIVCVGIFGIPIVLVLGIMLSLGLFMGWVSAGVVFGRWLARVLKLSDQRLTVTAALGTAILTLAAGLLSSLPFLLGGWIWTLLSLAITCAGLGAVALTRYGTRTFPIPAGSTSEKIEIVMDTLPEDNVPPK